MKQNKGIIAIACIIAAFSACGLSVKKIPAGTIIPQTELDHYIEIEGVRLHYREYPARGQVVFMQHGFASSTYSFEKIASILNARGYRVIAMDLKGSGWSDKPIKSDYSPLRLKEEINAFMQAMNIRDAVYVGNSLGGGLGVMLAIDHPERVKKLVLLDPGGYPMKKPGVVSFASCRGSSWFAGIVFGRWMVKRYLKDAYYRDDLLTDETIDAYYTRLCTENALKAIEMLSRSIDFSLFDKYKDSIPRITQQTLIIWGEKDTWIPVKYAANFKRDIPHSKLVVIPSCGHVPQEEYPDETARLIIDFIEGKPIEESPIPAAK